MANPAQSMPPPININDIFISGFMDSINPGALTSIIWLIVFLAVVGRTRQRILRAGAQFAIAYFLGNLAITMGLLDVIAAFFDVHVLLRSLQLFVAVVAVVLGFVCLYDWWQYAQGSGKGGYLLKYPVLVFNEDAEQGQLTSSDLWIFREGFLICSWIVGILVAFLGAVWPPSYVITQLQGGLYLEGERVLSFLFVLSYEVIFGLPFLAVFILIVSAVYSEKIVRSWRDSIGAVKMVFAGLLLGWGLSLIYLFW